MELLTPTIPFDSSPNIRRFMFEGGLHSDVHRLTSEAMDLSDKSSFESKKPSVHRSEATADNESRINCCERNNIEDHPASDEERDMSSPSSSRCSSFDDVTGMMTHAELDGDQAVAMRQNHVSSVMLRGVSIVSLIIDGKERLCLAQISNTLLKDFSYNEIHNRRVALGITCVQCTPVQLEILRRFGAMPISSRRCGMITKREAERLVTSFLEEHAPPKLPDTFAFSVVHECGWGCRGSFIPSRYNSSRAKCIKCSYCSAFLSPNKFIFHFHRTADAKYHHPDAANFNSWRRHLVLDYEESNEALVHAWEDVKAMFNGGSRKRLSSSPSNSKGSSGSGNGNSGTGGNSTESSNYTSRKRQRSIESFEANAPFIGSEKTSSNSKISSFLSTFQHHRVNLMSSPPSVQPLQSPANTPHSIPPMYAGASLPAATSFSMMAAAMRPPISPQYYDAMKMQMLDIWRAKALPPPAMMTPFGMFWNKDLHFAGMQSPAAAASALLSRSVMDVKQHKTFDAIKNYNHVRNQVSSSLAPARFPEVLCSPCDEREHYGSRRHGFPQAPSSSEIAHWSPFSAFKSLRAVGDMLSAEQFLPSVILKKQGTLSDSLKLDVVPPAATEKDEKGIGSKVELSEMKPDIVGNSLAARSADRNGNNYLKSVEEDQVFSYSKDRLLSENSLKDTDSNSSSSLPRDWPLYKPAANSKVTNENTNNPASGLPKAE